MNIKIHKFVQENGLDNFIEAAKKKYFNLLKVSSCDKCYHKYIYGLLEHYLVRKCLCGMQVSYPRGRNGNWSDPEPIEEGYVFTNNRFLIWEKTNTDIEPTVLVIRMNDYELDTYTEVKK